MADPPTRKREITALSEAMAELKLREGTIVTRGEEEQNQVESGKITVVPAWRFLLDLLGAALKKDSVKPDTMPPLNNKSQKRT